MQSSWSILGSFGLDGCLVKTTFGSALLSFMKIRLRNIGLLNADQRLVSILLRCESALLLYSDRVIPSLCTHKLTERGLI